MDVRQNSAKTVKDRPPPAHRAFSSLSFAWHAGSAAQIAEDDDGGFDGVLRDEGVVEDTDEEEGADGGVGIPEAEESNAGGWLEEDDIEEA